MRNYGTLNNIIHSLYGARKRAQTDDEKIYIQQLLSLAFNISYNRPIQDSALTDLAKSLTKVTVGDWCDLAKNMLNDVKTHMPENTVLINKLQTYIIFS